jgi:hypothetical protein
VRKCFRCVGILFIPLVLSCLCPSRASGEVMLQWFESDWDEMYRRMPEVAEIGYDYIWAPPPTKAPTGQGTKWANVGYNLYDRFDIGDVPQRGSLGTRYGTRGSLENMVKKAHQLDVKIIPDIIMNHNGNGPDYREYPGMTAEDFHVTWSESYVNTLNYDRGPRMDQWSANNGFGGTMWQELAQLIDIRTEDDGDYGRIPDPDRFTGEQTHDGIYFNFVGSRPYYLRHPGQFDRYPYYPADYTNEHAVAMLDRWIAWLGDAIDYDGLRLDAGKHTPYEFFGWQGNGFLHEAQYNYNLRRGYEDDPGLHGGDEADELFENYLSERDDALIFAEILSPWNEIEYWYGYGTNDRNPMRFLDYAMKQHSGAKFNGDLNGLGGYGSDFGPNSGITYVWGHDEGPANNVNLAYAYILTHIGMPMVYFTGNNITWENYGRAAYDPNNPNANKTWMVPGYDSQALGDEYNDIPNLVWIHQNFAWGSEEKIWENDSDYFALERYSDTNGDGRQPGDGDAIMVMALNDSGWDLGKTLTTSFENGTVLKDYTGHAGDVTVGSGGQVYIEVPGNGGQGWVCYAPKNADPAALSFTSGVAGGVTNIEWVVPGGTHANDKTNFYTRITSSNLTMTVDFTATGGSVDNVMFKWGQGKVKLGANNHYTNNNDFVVGNYEELTEAVVDSQWSLTVDLPDTIPEGLNVVKARLFNARSGARSYPALFNTITEVVYVDRWGPELEIESPAQGETVNGDCVMMIRNPDYTAHEVFVIEGGVTNEAYEVMKGLWKCELADLSTGLKTVTVKATEADWSDARNIINESEYTRNYTVATPSPISVAVDGGTNLVEVPFFSTTVTAAGASDVRLYWDGYRLPLDGALSNTFNGNVVFDADPANVTTQRLWGAFVNGEHFFEAIRVDGGVTSRVVERVTFDLYGGVAKYDGIGIIDSDGDGVPDNVEMPYFQDGAPGPDQAWPGDDNDFVPESWESWSRLNPYNHSTFYSGQWDDQNDFDGDGFSNGAEVLAGYNEHNDIYWYDIYDASDFPSGSATTNSSASWTPTTAVRGQNLQITYTPADGPLEGESAVSMHVGHSVKTMGEWQEVETVVMTESGDDWVGSYAVPTNASSVDFVFKNGDSTVWDSNGGSDWQAQVDGVTNRYFNMNGSFDGEHDGAYTVFEGGSGVMRIDAAVRGGNLYVATHGADNDGSDHFLFVTDELGDAEAAMWGKDGMLFFELSQKPYLASEGADYSGLNNVDGDIANSASALEAEFSLVDAFGSLPEAVYIAAVAYGDNDTDGIVAQGPHTWNGDNNLDIMEFQRVPIASIEDADGDGAFDGARPQMWTVVGGDTNNANYGLRRMFLNELAGDETEITVIVQPNADGTNVVSDVELFSNINRRDFAVMEENFGSVSTLSQTNYYRAYEMESIGGGRYAYTIGVNKCGAYRINARYRVNGGPYVYYTDNGLRRDCAVVASPKKALELIMYELNPMFVEATSDEFAGRSTFEDVYTVNVDRPDRVNTNYFDSLGLNMMWLQPIHPIGSEGRQTDPDTGFAYEPGSPYAVHNYWQVNAVLGDSNNTDRAMTEFTDFVGAMDSVGVGVMLDGTFNHSAWDCQIGQIGVDMGLTYEVLSTDTNGITTTNIVAVEATDLIRDVRPEWYSRTDQYGEHASYYESGSENNIAVAPDRIDFGKWSDAADFNFGTYDCLVQEAAGNTNNAWASRWNKRYLLEEDRFEGHDAYTRELWEYFSRYSLYWMAQTAHPAGTPPEESSRGIDGLRCDFAQGLPSTFWEYCINKTRSVKWDFLFMAESLDGYSEVAGSKRHGVGYRSSRHFDILNENMVFYWKSNFFDYPDRNNPQPHTDPVRQALDDRRNAFDASPILLNLTSHDEIYPSHDPYRVLYAHAICGAVDGVPMVMYGQEAGAQNDFNTYANGGEITSDAHNFARYELNFGKSIANFKRYNHMTNIWHNRDQPLQDAYARINNARLDSPALKSQGMYFLSLDGGGGYDADIFAVAKFEAPGVSASTQDVVLVFVNNNYWGSTNRSATFSLDADYGGNNWFGIEAGKSYNVVDLTSTTPTTPIWGSPRTGADLTANGIYVGLNGDVSEGQQAQYLKLYDIAVGVNYPDGDSDGIPDYADWDDDGDGLPDDWEVLHGLSTTSGDGGDGPDGDRDGDGMTNLEELRAGTDPNDPDDALRIDIEPMLGGVQLEWTAKSNVNYQVECADALAPTMWEAKGSLRTATKPVETDADYGVDSVTSRFYRVRVKP